MRRPVGSKATCLAERPRVTLVGLDAALAGGVHGREVGVGDDDLVAQGFEVAGAPLALGRGLDEDARLRPAAEQGVEARPLGLDAALDESAVFGQDADLAGVLVDVYPMCYMTGLTPSAVRHRVWLWGVIMSPREWRPAASSNSFMIHQFFVTNSLVSVLWKARVMPCVRRTIW